MRVKSVFALLCAMAAPWAHALTLQAGEAATFTFSDLVSVGESTRSDWGYGGWVSGMRPDPDVPFDQWPRTRVAIEMFESQGDTEGPPGSEWIFWGEGAGWQITRPYANLTLPCAKQPAYGHCIEPVLMGPWLDLEGKIKLTVLEGAIDVQLAWVTLHFGGHEYRASGVMSPVPEPGAFALFGAGLFGGLLAATRQSKRLRHRA